MTTPTDRDVPAAETLLFEDLAPPTSAQLRQAQSTAASRRNQGSPRLRQPNRSQIELQASGLESCVPPASLHELNTQPA